MTNITRRKAYIHLTPSLLAKRLEFPADQNIIGADWDFQHQHVRLFIEGPDLPITYEEDPLPVVAQAIKED